MADTRITKSEEPASYEDGRMLPPVDVNEDASGITMYP